MKTLKVNIPNREYNIYIGNGVLEKTAEVVCNITKRGKIAIITDTNVEKLYAGRLTDILSDYQGSKGCTLILVFDAYKVQGHAEEVVRYHNIYVVYTKEAETADQYIEKTVHEIGRKNHVTVATSDRLEQVIILGQGGTRMSARELREDMELVAGQIREETGKRQMSDKNYLFDGLDQDAAEYIEAVRLGKKETEQ